MEEDSNINGSIIIRDEARLEDNDNIQHRVVDESSFGGGGENVQDSIDMLANHA